MSLSNHGFAVSWFRGKVMVIVLPLLLLAALCLLLAPSSAHAYVGPGAGFALAGSFFAVFLALCLAVPSLLSWPLRLLMRVVAVLARRGRTRRRVQRVVILGLDGLDYGLTQKLLDEGKLAQIARRMQA